MDIFKTYNVIRNMFNVEINVGSIEEGYIDYGNESQLLFNAFSSNKIYKDFNVYDVFLY